MDKVKTGKTEFVKLVEEIVEKSNEPMSIDEILVKFAPDFPFEIKKVIDAGGSFSLKLEIGETVSVLEACKRRNDWWYYVNAPIRFQTPGNLKQWVLI